MRVAVNILSAAKISAPIKIEDLDELKKSSFDIAKVDISEVERGKKFIYRFRLVMDMLLCLITFI